MRDIKNELKSELDLELCVGIESAGGEVLSRGDSMLIGGRRVWVMCPVLENSGHRWSAIVGKETEVLDRSMPVPL